MQADTLPLTHGWTWIQDGARLFLRQPLAMCFWSLTASLLITLAYLIPLLGQMLLIAAMPALTFLTLCACRHIAHGKPMRPGMWLQPLGVAGVRGSMIRLGLAYLGACMLSGLVATLPFIAQITSAVNDAGMLDEAALRQAMRGPFLAFGLLYVLISALFWHAPALMGWHGIKLTQALFYSMVACWRNKWPFLLYCASWAAIFFGVQTLGGLLVQLGLAPDMIQLLLTPVNIVMAAVLYCSFYPTYMSVFGANYPATT